MVFTKELDRKFLNLLTFKNKKVIDNHTCNAAKYKNYNNKINDIISKLKDSWKNEYKNNKM